MLIQDINYTFNVFKTTVTKCCSKKIFRKSLKTKYTSIKNFSRNNDLKSFNIWNKYNNLNTSKSLYKQNNLKAKQQ